MLVHFDSPELLKNYVLFGVEVDATLVSRFDMSHLSKNWKDNPVPVEVQAIGDNWIESRSSVVLSVPSAVVPDEFNFLINPSHPDFAKLRIHKPVAFQFNPRFASKHRST